MQKIIGHDTRAQEAYWHKLTQFKFDLIYYSLHFSSCVTIMRLIRISSAALTALVTGAWMNWNELTPVRLTCGIIILVLQAISAGAELLPYDRRKQEIRELLNLLGPIYDEMEADWVKISDGQFTKADIQNKIYEYTVKKRDVHQHFFKDDALPEKKKLEEKADEETSTYFKMMF